MTRIALLAATSLTTIFLAASAAPAQDAASAPEAVAAAERAAVDDEAIVVTAQRREQRLVDVPIAITTYDGEFLERLGINEFEELSRFVPGFEVQNQSPNNPGFVIRGITSDTGTAFNEPRISVFQDGVSISKSRGSYVELFDMRRIEVVKGPQSTLYGRGALIGGVNLIQNKADPDRLAAFGKIGFGNLDSRLLEGMVNVPLGDRAAVRVSGRLRQRDGYVDNLRDGEDFGSADTWAIRGALHFAPTDRIAIDLIGNYQEDHPSGTPFKSRAFRPTDPVTGAVLGSSDPADGATLAPGVGFEGGRDLGLDRTVWGLTALVRARLSDSLTLNSITGYREFDALEIFDADGISLPALTAAEDARGEQFSQEFRLTFDNNGPLTAFVGASFFHDKGSQRTPVQFDERVALARLTGTLNGPIPGRPATDPAPLAVFGNTAFTGALLQGVAAANGYALNPVLAQAIAANLKSGHLETATNFAETNSVDLFADVTYEVTDRLELGAGLRYTHDDKTSAISASVLNGRSILGGFIGALSQPEPIRTALLTALAAPSAATIPPSAAFPVPLFGLGFQPTANNGDRIEEELKDNGFSWRFNARYAINGNSSLYASYARGRRPEVLSALPPAAPFGASRFDLVDSETADSFELGARHQRRGLYLDGSIFYYKYNNFQTTEQEGTLFVTTNAGKAETYGFEGQLRWDPITLVSLFATYAYNHSRFETGAREGNRFRLSPDHKLSLGATFGGPLGPGRIEFTPTLTYQSKIFFDDDNDRPELQTVAGGALIADLVQDEVQKGYALVNARLGYDFGERFRVELFGNNLLDKKYIKDAGNTGDALGLPTFIAAEPRTYGVQLSARF